MKKLLAFIILVGIVAGCKKDDDNTPSGPPPKGPASFVEIQKAPLA